MTTANRKGSHEAKIRELLEGWSSALRAKDTDRVMSHYAAELVQFDLAPPLKYAGANALSSTTVLQERSSTKRTTRELPEQSPRQGLSKSSNGAGVMPLHAHGANPEDGT
jgi:hypothetical protein